jgi:hypothetical protein
MFLNPDWNGNQAVEQVYLDGFLGQCEYPCAPWYATMNPNSGVAGSSFTTTLQFAAALFGVWKDCNRDGYVGLADQGLMEYRTTLLDATFGESICPSQQTPPGPQGLPPLNWFPSHNDGTWVREYLAFSFNTPSLEVQDTNPWDVNLLGPTALWYDDGLPGPTSGGPTCWIYPQPVGTFRSTGGALAFADCFNGYQVTHAFDQAADGNNATKPLSFSDVPDGQQGKSRSLLNVANPWGSENGASDAEVWDCSKPQPVHEAITQTDDVNVSAPKVPPSVATGGTVGGTMNDFGSGFDQCVRNNQPANTWIGGVPTGVVLAIVLAGQLHEGSDLADLPYATEGTVDATAKMATSNMGPGSGGIYMDQRPFVPVSGVTGKSTPPDMGVRPVDDDGIWQGGAVRAGNGFLNEYSLPPSFVPVQYETYYAYVDPTTVTTYGLSLPAGTKTASYGAEACGSAIGGIVNGWDCNSADWTSGTRVGDPYNLRDVDCYDNSVQAARQAGVSWGLLTQTQCAYAR